MQSGGLDINDLLKEAQTRWLKPAEVFSILQNHENYQLTPTAPDKPTSGSLLLFNKRVLRFFRRDGHNWRKKKDGRTVGEAHERLKVGNCEALNCYYAHGEDNPNFQRRSYWMLDPAFEHIVLVHYRDISEGKHISGPISQFSPGYFSTLVQSPMSCTNHNPHSFSVASGVNVSYHNQSSPGSVEDSSEIVKTDSGIDYSSSSSDFEVSQALRKLKEQLSLNDESYGDIGIFLGQDDNSGVQEYEREWIEQNDSAYSPHGHEFAGVYIGSNNNVQQQDAGEQKEYECQTFGDEYIVNWGERLDSSKNSPGIKSQDNSPNTMGRNETPLCSSGTGLSEELGNSHWLNFSGNNTENASILLPQREENFRFPYSFGVNYPQENNPGYSEVLFGQIQLGMPPEADSSLTIAQTQKFTIREISPEWGYVSEVTKVIVIGSFLCNPSECAWACMFGNIEVPIQIIQEGVIICEAPPCLPGKVTLCITSGNRESCSEVREFEFRANPTYCSHDSITQAEVKSSDELLLLVRFVQMFLSDALIHKSDSANLGVDVLRKLKADDEAWDQVIEALLVGSGVSSVTLDWLLQELLKDKFKQWISYKSLQVCDPSGCVLSRKEQGIIHMVAGLGFEWALNPVLGLGVGINFRDINGWTALHWAARFGREKMVAALIASGASAGAVTDPNSQDLTGKTPASIAANSGHKGLAGYLSELALTTHLSSLKMEESELSKGSADVEAEITVSSVSKGNFTTSEDQLSLKDTLAAVRNAAQAAARIQSAFRAHSFRRRQEKTVAAGCDEYGISPYDAQELSAILSKLAFRNARDYNSAAVSIQKKYRGWKGRKDFLAFRQKVVKIQAYVRGHQVRKNYKFCWAVSILDKVILRWRRRGAGLRGFRTEAEYLEDSEDEEDIMKVFRRQKVDATIDEAVSSVLSMVESPGARQQYRRMLERYRQAKAELVNTTNEAASTSQNDVFGMDKDDMYLFS